MDKNPEKMNYRAVSQKNIKLKKITKPCKIYDVEI